MATDIFELPAPLEPTRTKEIFIQARNLFTAPPSAFPTFQEFVDPGTDNAMSTQTLIDLIIGPPGPGISDGGHYTTPVSSPNTNSMLHEPRTFLTPSFSPQSTQLINITFHRRQPAHSGRVQAWSLEKEETGNLTEDLNTVLGVGGHDNQGNGVNSALQVNPETRFDSSGGWRTSSAIVVPPYTMDITSGLNNSANQIEGPPPRLLDTTGIDFIVSRVIQITGRRQANNSGNVIINAFAERESEDETPHCLSGTTNVTALLRYEE
ncbi:hypothetical protein M422DRAFT_267370 [Sphaerobolus stellatus SS14]|uniref:Unplaced genomic scaffold SPHSTscaffold_174, whole genome shotgun sequence n=1 Tax=Sphaerobolus stellatus (strain SS14) TaxID=990650 RepID=A0A0C9V0V7_SPHS4|nr:hypothetical protein M422DRAFT_267370 [Sphaerobolus stellatus SS14]